MKRKTILLTATGLIGASSLYGAAAATGMTQASAIGGLTQNLLRDGGDKRGGLKSGFGIKIRKPSIELKKNVEEASADIKNAIGEAATKAEQISDAHPALPADAKDSKGTAPAEEDKPPLETQAAATADKPPLRPQTVRPASETVKIRPAKKSTPAPAPTHEAKDEPLMMVDGVIPDHVPGQILYFSALTGRALKQIAADGDVQIIAIDLLDQIGVSMVTAKIKGSDSVSSALDRLEKLGGVAWAQPNHVYQLLGNSRSKGYELHGIKSGTATKKSGTIILIDSPVDVGNEALKGANIREELFGIKGIPAAHGTAIAELLVGTGEFGGVAQGAKLISLAAFGAKGSMPWRSQTRRIARAMNQAIILRPNVANLSFGTPSDDKAMGRLLDKMEGKGICVVTAAGNGNGGKVLFPGRYETTLSVTAVDAGKRAYEYASRGAEIDTAAWGVNMNAAVPGGRRSVSGTSFATALVSGSVLASPACQGQGDPAAMRAAVAKAAQDLGAPGRDDIYGAGLFRFGEMDMGEAAPKEEAPAEMVEEQSNMAAILGGAAAALSGLFLFFLWWRKRKKTAAT